MLDMLRKNALEQILAAAWNSCSRDVVCQTVQWCCENPQSRTAGRILNHLAHIVDEFPMPGDPPAMFEPDAYRQAFSHAVDVLMYDLHYDLCRDVDETDRVAIIALLV